MFHMTEACKTFKFIPYVTANPAMPAKKKKTKKKKESQFWIKTHAFFPLWFVCMG